MAVFKVLLILYGISQGFTQSIHVDRSGTLNVAGMGSSNTWSYLGDNLVSGSTKLTLPGGIGEVDGNLDLDPSNSQGSLTVNGYDLASFTAG